MGKRLLASLSGLMLLVASTLHAKTVRLVYTDVQGTVIAKTDVQGTILARYDYRPYGAPVSGGLPQGPGYTGHVNDPEAGLVYMQARYYDPVVGRFLSVDPVTSFARDRYTYANNNPLKFTDPDGRLAGIFSDWRGDYNYDHFGRRKECNFCLSEKTFKEKLQRNGKWLLRSVKVQLGVRLGLNAKIKVGKLARFEIGTGYLGESGELNGYLEYAQLYQGKGPSLALQLGRLKLGGEAGGWETRTRISVSRGLSIEEKREAPFFLVGLESGRDYALSQGNISVEANPLILHGEISVNVTGVAASLFYWGDSDLDPSE